MNLRRPRAGSRQGMAMLCALVGSLCAGHAPAVIAQLQQGRVTHVVDGATLDVLAGDKRLRIRLVEIDAPERDQPYGHRSRQSLIALCGGELAMIQRKGEDPKGRVLAQVSCGGRDAGTEQVRRGMAWVFDRCATPESPLYAVQAEARDAGRGLWVEGAGGTPVAPAACTPYKQRSTP